MSRTRSSCSMLKTRCAALALLLGLIGANAPVAKAASVAPNAAFGAASGAAPRVSPAPVRLGAPASAPVPFSKTAVAFEAHRPAPSVAMDIGDGVVSGGRSASGLPGHNFNLRFAAAVQQQLRRLGVQVKRLPPRTASVERMRRAKGSGLVLSLSHAGLVAPGGAAGSGQVALKQASAGTVSGYALAVAGSDVAGLSCARQIGRNLQATGRHFSDRGGAAWADAQLGVHRLAAPGPWADVAPAVQMTVAHIGTGTEEALARNAAWVDRQAAAVARAVRTCLARRN